MDRTREARRASMAASNGVSRRRHRSGSLRDSADEDGPVELQEPMARLRDRGLKKDRDRERDRSSRSKRRRGDKLMHGGDDTSDESANEEEEYEEEGGGSMMMLPPNPAQSISSSMNNHHQQHPKIFPPLAYRIFRGAPALKAADEMIGVSVPRKARSASTKRMHDWISGGGGVGGDLIHWQESASPVRPPQAAPVSPPSSNASVRKKIPNGAKPRPPKSSKPSTSNPEELEIEIAEVLYGLRTQSQGRPCTKEIASDDTAKIDSLELNKSSGDAKSRVSSPTSNTPSAFPQSSPLLPHSSSAPLSVVAPKRKRPRQVSENLGNFSSRSSPSSTTAMKMEIDQHLNTKISSPALEENSGTPADNSLSSPPVSLPTEEMKLDVSALSESNPATEEAKDVSFVISTKKEVTSPKEFPSVGLAADREDVTATTVGTKGTDIEDQKEEKIQIDLMAPPPQLRSSPVGEDLVNFVAAGDSNVDADMTDKEGEKVGKIGNTEAGTVGAEERAKETMEEAVDSQNQILNKESDNDLKLLQKPDLNGGILQQGGLKLLLQPTKVTRDEQRKEKPAQTSSFPLPMAVGSWPAGLSPMGYMAPLQGLVSMDGNTMSSTPIQPLFSQPRGKRCATHFHIAQNIQYIQQLMKMNPFWPAAASSSPLFGAKPCNFNVMPPSEFNGNITGRTMSSLQDKGQNITIFPAHSEKDKTVTQAEQRKQPILLQQTVPPVPPNNILHGPAFIFPFNQQQVAAQAQPASAKSPTTPVNLAANTTAPPSVTTMSFNFPNMSPSETQYLAILQNNGYPLPPGGPPNYRGTHPQAVPLFNGSFYPSQMIHPSQLQQHQPHQSQSHQSSGSSSSQKHLQGQQQRPQGSSVNSGTGIGNFQNFPAPKSRPQNERGNEDTPSTADSRVSSRVSMPSQNFSMSIHPQSFAMVSSSTCTGNQNEKKQQQHGAMSFVPANGSSINISSQDRKGQPVLKSLPASGLSIAFSRSELADPSGGSAASPCNTTATTDGSACALNTLNSHLSSLYQNQKLDQQQLIKLHKLHQQQYDQQQIVARNKSPVNNGGAGAYPDHLTSTVKFQNVLANSNTHQSYKQKNTSTTSGSDPKPTQSPAQWKNSAKTTPNPQLPSSLSSSTLKNHVQPQARLQQISFGSNHKPSVVATNTQPPNNTTLSPTSVAVSSPTHSSISKCASPSNKTGQGSTHSSSVLSQKPSILGNPPLTAASSSGSGTKMQQQQQAQQLSKQSMQQGQLFFSNHYMQPQQGPTSSTVSASSGYYV